MRRKDGLKKRVALRSKPAVRHGLRDDPSGRINGQAVPEAKDSITVTSLFTGCGGLDLGFQGGFEVLGATFPRLPVNILAAVDNSKDAIEAYRLNLGNEALLGDLTEIPPEDLPSADVLLGGFPCQDFSSSGPKTGLSGERGRLYRVLSNYMKVHLPKVVVAENVPHFARLAGGEIIRTVLREFEEVGYRFNVWELYAPDYGLPQSRRRIFLVGVRNDLEGSPTKPTPTHAGHHLSIDEALRDLEDVEDESVPNQGQFFVATKATAGGGQGDHTNQRGEVAYCIRANARGRIQFHYSLERRLTVRECARLQSFPDGYAFPFTTQRNLTLIGNAVPPLLGHHVARSIVGFLKGAAAPIYSDAASARTALSQPPLFTSGVD